MLNAEFLFACPPSLQLQVKQPDEEDAVEVAKQKTPHLFVQFFGSYDTALVPLNRVIPFSLGMEAFKAKCKTKSFASSLVVRDCNHASRPANPNTHHHPPCSLDIHPTCFLFYLLLSPVHVTGVQ